MLVFISELIKYKIILQALVNANTSDVWDVQVDILF